MDKADDTMYIASISYGKDSLAMLEAIRQLNYPLDRIITAQVWATKDIPAIDTVCFLTLYFFGVLIVVSIAYLVKRGIKRCSK